MKPLLRTPTRDANDSDHLAIMLLVGGLYSFSLCDTLIDLRSPWLIVALMSVITAPFLWMRLPYAKWGGVAVSLTIPWIYLSPLINQGFSIKVVYMSAAFLVIIYWFIKIDYNHVCPE